jgi:hypothetical protein
MSSSAGTVVRLFQGKTRIASARVLESGAVLEVYPHSLKVFASEASWKSYYTSTSCECTTPADQKKLRDQKQNEKLLLNQQKKHRWTQDQRDIESLYTKLGIADTLTKKGTVAKRYSPLQVKLGNAIHMLYFHRESGMIGIAGSSDILREFLHQPQYFYQSTRYNPLVQIFPYASPTSASL